MGFEAFNFIFLILFFFYSQLLSFFLNRETSSKAFD